MWREGACGRVAFIKAKRDIDKFFCSPAIPKLNAYSEVLHISVEQIKFF